MKHLTTGQIIVESLRAHGVDTLFGIPGAHMYDFIDALHAERDNIRFITTRHEQGAAYMAFGYAKATGKVGAYTVVPGPGVLNSGAALCTAFGATAPVLCITGNIMSHLIGQGRGQLHELPDQLALLRGLTKWAARIDHPSQAGGVMEEAFAQLRGGRVRPVAVEVPWDVFGMAVDVLPAAAVTPPPPPIPDPELLGRAVAILQSARNPLITVGAGALHAGLAVAELSQLLQAPVTAHRSGKGILSDDSDYAMSMAAARKYWADADVLIGIGSRLELQHFRWQWLPPGLKVIRIDIDPTEMVRLPADAGIVADADEGTRALLAQLRGVIKRRGSRAEEFRGLKTQARRDIERIQPQMGYLDAIRDVLPRDGYFVEEVSQVGFTARFGFEVYEPRHYVTCGYQDNLGFGFNTALGVKIAKPDHAVVSVCGDGGFMFGVQELATAVHYGINLVTVVFNNQAYGNVLRDQTNTYQGRILGAELTNPDFVALAESFGALGLRAANPHELRQALEQGFAADQPVIIEVAVPQGSEISPWSVLHPAAP